MLDITYFEGSVSDFYQSEYPENENNKTLQRNLGFGVSEIDFDWEISVCVSAMYLNSWKTVALVFKMFNIEILNYTEFSPILKISLA